MLDPIVRFFTSIFAWIGRGIGWLVALLVWPFAAFGRWYRRTHVILKVILGFIILGILIPYGYFIWNVSWIRNYDINYPDRLKLDERLVAAGEQAAIEGGTDTTRTCGRSSIVDAQIELIDFNVNQNAWISASLPYKLGLFGIPWDATPWMDNKASFQRGVHRAVTRTAVELADVLGRIRGTSAIDGDLQDARGNVQIDEFNWYFGFNPFGFKQTSWGSYKQAMKSYRAYNARLEDCSATFDARADNLMQFIDRIAKDIGSMSAVIKDRAERYNGGWFDTRADNIFMESKGMLYAYYGMINAARSDFRDIIEKRALTDLWSNMESQLVSALNLNPIIISNGVEDGSIMPTHLTTMGFYILRVRSNLVEIRSVLDR